MNRANPEGVRLPIKLDTTSNDEFAPAPLSRAMAHERSNYLENPTPHFQTYGPKTRREFHNLLARGGG